MVASAFSKTAETPKCAVVSTNMARQDDPDATPRVLRVNNETASVSSQKS